MVLRNPYVAGGSFKYKWLILFLGFCIPKVHDSPGDISTEVTRARHAMPPLKINTKQFIAAKKNVSSQLELIEWWLVNDSPQSRCIYVIKLRALLPV